MNLRIPGPTPLRPEVAEASARPMLNHRSPAMARLLSGLRDKLGQYLSTKAEVFLLAASGTAGLEASIVNTLSPGDSVLGVSGGVFGERYCRIAEAYGLDVDRLEVAWGRACEPEALSRALSSRQYRAVFMTHNETATGILHPVEALARVVREHSDALVLVDAISSLGAAPLAMDACTDLVVSGSQKAWGAPPGVAMLFVSPRIWQAHRSAALPKFYLDLSRYREAAESGGFPNTPATSVLQSLEVAVDLMLARGAESIFEEHRRIATHTRKRLQAGGVSLFADPRYASPTVTALAMPDGIDGRAVASDLRERFQIEIGGGQAKLGGKILRIGHLGWIVQTDIDACIDALADSLARFGFSPRLG